MGTTLRARATKGKPSKHAASPTARRRPTRPAWVHEQILARSRDARQRALAEAEQRIVMLEVDGVGHVTDSDERYGERPRST